LILSTIHSAKCQEWKSVFVLNVVDGRMPSDLGIGTSAELEEERRLLYVAMTRAKDDLHLIVPQRFFTHGQHAQGDRHIYASRTRFIPDRLLGLFEKTVWPIFALAGPAGTVGTLGHIAPLSQNNSQSSECVGPNFGTVGTHPVGTKSGLGSRPSASLHHLRAASWSAWT